MGCKKFENALGYSFQKYGQLIGRRPLPFLLLPLICTLIVGPGLLRLVYDDDIVMLFTPYNAPSRQEQQIARRFSHTAAPDKNSSRFTLPVSSSTPYSDLWFNLQVMSNDNLMTQHSWSLISEYVTYVYKNFTCTVDEWVEAGDTENVSRGNVLQYGRDFCNPNRGCIQVNEMVDRLVNLLNKTKYGHNKNVRLTYPVMYVWDHPFNWGQYVFSVKYDRESGNLESARLVVLYFHFQVTANDVRAQRAAQSCVRQLTEMTLKWNELHPEVKDAGITFFTLNEPFVAEQVNRISVTIMPYLAATILLILAFVAVTSFRRRFPVLSLVEASMGLLTVGLSLLASFGFLCLIGVHMNFVVTVTPFLVLVVGIDNDFLITSAWRKTADGYSSIATRLGRAFADCGPSLTITSVNDILCFGIGYLSETPAIADFCLHTCVGLLFRFIFQMTFFAAVIAYLGYLEQRSGDSNMGKWRFICHTRSIAAIDPLPPKKSIPSISPPVGFVDPRISCVAPKVEHRRIHEFFRHQYASFLMRRSVRVVALLLYAAYVVVAVIGAAKWVVDISPQKLFLDDSPIQVAMNNCDHYMLQQTAIGRVFVTSPPDFRYKSNVDRFFQFVRALENVDDRNFSQNHTISKVDTTDLWLRQYFDFLQYLVQPDEFETDDEKKSGEFQEDFYDYLPTFLDSADYNRFVNDLRFKKPSNDSEALKLDKFQFVISYFRSPEHPYSYDDHVEIMQRWREICSNYSDYHAVIYENTQLNPYFDQRLTLAPACLQSMGIALLTVSAVTALLMPDLRSMFFICLSFLSVDVGVIAGLKFWNCDLDPTSVAFVLMTIGFSVYYTARVCYCYQSAHSAITCDEKMRRAMDTVGWPISQGALATVLGVMPDVLVPWYTVRVFYRTVVLVVVIGLAHGLLAMPVLMSAFDQHTSPLSERRRREAEKKRGKGNVTPLSADTLSECSS